ncbi:hypothetical protein GGR50DRAFT_658982 [Xylaria sp. CBS 124048]|nr:hypothetical protein GGR50DRAFT_658982 [Xylaria sp. CBS 124048]
MSINLNWEALTGGPDGEALAEQIRDFIHVKFQAVPLPRFIKSVTVHSFAFGKIPPSVVLKDICDPLPDFYEEDYEPVEKDDAEGNASEDEGVPDAIRAAERRRRAELRAQNNGGGGGGGGGADGDVGRATGGVVPFGEGYFPSHVHTAGLRNAPAPDLSSPFLGLGVPKHGVPLGASKMHYLQSKLSPAGWPGTQTPLAAVTRAQRLDGWLEATSPSQGQPHYIHRSASNSSHHRHLSQGEISVEDFPSRLTVPSQSLRDKHSVSTPSPTSTSIRDMLGAGASSGLAVDDDYDDDIGSQGADKKDPGKDDEGSEGARKFHEPRPEDMQAVFRIRYAGDVRLELTAMILLDYPMPSFVGIPLKLNITGLTFDGVGVIAYIRKRVHFCFLSPDDAIAAVGDDDGDLESSGHARWDSANSESKGKGRTGGLLQEIRVDSEIGQREGVKQSLKNVGKVEKFVLEQVRRIFEEEFVYPSFWTFLV